MPLLSDESFAATIPGLHKALIEQHESDAKVIDPRIALMGPQEMVHLLHTDPAGAKALGPHGFSKEIAILKGGDPHSCLVQETLAAVKQEISDAQPHAKSLRAGAEKLRQGKPHAVGYEHVLDIVGAENFPLDLDELHRIHRETGRAPGIVCMPDDSVRLAEHGEPVHW